MKNFAIAAAVICAAGTVASADVTINFTNLTLTGFQFQNAFPAGTLTGNFTGASINAVLDASTNFTYADDLTVYVDAPPLSTGGAAQIGGFSSLGALERLFWANGGSEVPGTTVIDTQILTTPIAIDTFDVQIGNGYGASGTSGTWTGSITLHGVTLVPAPGALALVGLGGLVVGRRRR